MTSLSAELFTAVLRSLAQRRGSGAGEPASEHCLWEGSQSEMHLAEKRLRIHSNHQKKSPL